MEGPDADARGPCDRSRTALPDLKPGEYLLLLTLRDQGTAKTMDVTLPFSVAE